MGPQRGSTKVLWIAMVEVRRGVLGHCERSPRGMLLRARSIRMTEHGARDTLRAGALLDL